MNILLTILKNNLAEVIKMAFTIETLQSFLKMTVEKIREKTEETDNQFDDWIPDFLESILSDPEKISILYSFIMSYLPYRKRCYSRPGGAIKRLADELSAPTQDVDNYAIIDLLDVMMPYFSDWCQNVTH